MAGAGGAWITHLLLPNGGNAANELLNEGEDAGGVVLLDEDGAGAVAVAAAAAVSFARLLNTARCSEATGEMSSSLCALFNSGISLSLSLSFSGLRMI